MYVLITNVPNLNLIVSPAKHQILRNQSPINGLFPSIGSDKNTNRIAHVQDSIYCAVAVWSLAQVYKYFSFIISCLVFLAAAFFFFKVCHFYINKNSPSTSRDRDF